jgi:voltage-gated potassium channel
MARSLLNRVRFVLGAMIVTHLVGGACFSLSEGKSFIDGQWWATVTGATVGYGDFYPQTVIGKIAAMIYIWLMLFWWAVIVALLVATIIEDKNLFTHEEQERMEAVQLEIAQHLGILPPEMRELPPIDWWRTHKGFVESSDS